MASKLLVLLAKMILLMRCFFCMQLSSEEYLPNKFSFPEENFRLIQKGGFGTVYQFKKPELADQVIKVIDIKTNCKERSGLGFDFQSCVEQSIEEVKKEIEINEELRAIGKKAQEPFNFSAYLPDYIGFLSDEANSQYGLVFKKLEGHMYEINFRELFAFKSALPFFLTCQSLFKSIFVFHNLGFNHCDLKPANIMLKNFKNILQTFVPIDVGKTTKDKLCRRSTPYYSDPRLSSENQLNLNTEAPLPATRRADIYSLAVSILEEVTNQKHDEEVTPEQTLKTFREMIKARTGESKPAYRQLYHILWLMMRKSEKAVTLLEVLIMMENVIVELQVALPVENYEKLDQWLVRLLAGLVPLKKFDARNFAEADEALLPEFTKELNKLRKEDLDESFLNVSGKGKWAWSWEKNPSEYVNNNNALIQAFEPDLLENEEVNEVQPETEKKSLIFNILDYLGESLSRLKQNKSSDFEIRI